MFNLTYIYIYAFLLSYVLEPISSLNFFIKLTSMPYSVIYAVYVIHQNVMARRVLPHSNFWAVYVI